MYNYNFFQSELWKTINKDIYKKSIFEITLSDGKKYWGIQKEKRKGILSFRWYQVLGVKFADLDIEEDLKRINRDFKVSYGDIMFQFGFIDVIGFFKGNQYKNDKVVEIIKEERDVINQRLNKFGLKPSFRENMPKGTVIIDLNVSDKEEFYKRLSSNARNHYNKGKRKGLIFEIANQKDWEEFYILRKQTSYQKGFSIIPRSDYDNLKDFLLNTKSGNLFVVKNKEGEIVSGSICLFDDKNSVLIYLYGATNRKFGNIGAHQFLKIEMFKWAYENRFLWVDLLGSPSFIEKDSNLWGVGRFKWSLGGLQVEWWGSYDYVLNDVLYKMFEFIKKG